MSPVANSFNTLGANNQQPEYQMLWEPMAIYPSSAITAITIPSAAGAGAWVAGAALQYGASGTTITAAGTNWPTGTSTSPSGDDYGGATPYTIQTVDIAAVSTTILAAGVLLGVGSLGANSPVAPNTITGRLPAQIAMVGKRGICQVLVDNTTVAGHTILPSTTATHTGQFSDSGGATLTYGTHVGVVLQVVTVSTGPLLAWVKVNFS